jgi:hypothetical protein
LGLIYYPYLEPTLYLQHHIEARVEQAARKFYHAIESHRQRTPSLSRVLQFRVLKCNTRVAGKYRQADQEFYKDKQTYCYDAKLALHTRLFGWLFERIYMGYMKKNCVLRNA